RIQAPETRDSLRSIRASAGARSRHVGPGRPSPCGRLPASADRPRLSCAQRKAMTTTNHDQSARNDVPAVEPGKTEAPKAATAQAPGLPEDMLIVLPVRNMVLFPGVMLPVAIKREKTVAGAQ